MPAEPTHACLQPELVLAFVAGSLDDAAAETIEVHIDACGSCRRLLVEAARDRFVSVTRDDAPSPAGGLTPPELPGYRVEALVSYGGLGAVWRATDLRLDRVVALKQLRRRDRGAEARFRREAEITARLQHPSIVPVYEAGRGPGDEPFYAMKLIEGRTLDEALAAAPSLAQRLALLPRVLAAARALAYAHDRGILHRDVKPSNVVLGAYGETVLLDWGLAKHVAAPDEERPRVPAGDAPYRTLAGTVLGTPGYMAPEQAAGRAVDARADVYALGAVLYHLLSGAPPYRATSAQALLDALAAGPPPPVDELQPDVPPALASLVHKAMARAPEARFAGASQLADELDRFTTGQLVGVHRYSVRELAARFVRRHVAAVVTAALAAALLVAGGTAALLNVARARRVAEEQRNSLLLAQAQSAIAVDPTAALAWLAKYPVAGADWRQARAIASEAFVVGVARYALPMAAPAQLDRRGGAVVWLEPNRLVRLDLASGERRVSALPAEQRGLAWAGAANALFVIGDGDTVERRAGGVAAPVVVCRDIGLARGELEVSPDGRWAAVTGRDGRLRVCDTTDGRVQLAPLPAQVDRVAFSGDSRRIAAATADGAIHWWEPGGGAPRPLVGHQGLVSVVRLSTDGRRLLSAGFDGSVRVWPLDGSGAAKVLHSRGGPVYSAAWPDDGARVAFADGDKSVRLWDPASGASTVLHRAERSIYEVSFSRDGHVLAWGDGNLIRIHDFATGQRHLLHGHGVEIGDLTFTDDRRWLRSWSLDGESRIWDLGALNERVIASAEVGATWVDLAADGRSLVAAWRNGALRLCMLDGAAPCRDLPGHASRIWKVKFTPDARFVVSNSDDGQVRVWDASSGVSRALSGHRGAVRALNVSPDSRLALTAGADGSARLWDLAAGEGRVVAPPEAQIRAVNFSSDGSRLALGGADGAVTLVDLAGGARHTLGGRTRAVTSVEFSPDGRRVAASSSDDPAITMWDLGGGAPRTFAGNAKPPSAIRFSPDGTLLASAGYDGSVRLWSASDGRARVLSGHRAGVGKLGFSRDGRLLFTGANDGTVRLWDVATGEGRVIGRHDGAVFALAVAPDAGGAVGAITDGSVRWWPAGESRIPVEPAAAHRTLEALVADAPTHGLLP